MIGIMGGAGPMAGILLQQKIIEECQALGCKVDSDFPHILQVSFPFSDMLEAPDPEIIAVELDRAIQFLQQSGATQVVIACNTLHGYLLGQKVLHIVEEIKQTLPSGTWLLLSTRASRALKVHDRLENIIYSKPIDHIIEAILEGKNLAHIAEAVKTIIFMDQPTTGIILGCSELSLLYEYLKGLNVIDPIRMLATRLARHHCSRHPTKHTGFARCSGDYLVP